MSDLSELFLNLLDEAEETNPDSVAVSTFREILETMDVGVTSRMTDVECNGSNTVFENHDEPELILTALKCLEDNRADNAVAQGLSDNIELGYGINSTLSLEFTRSDNFDYSNEDTYYTNLKKENLPSWDGEEDLVKHLESFFKQRILETKLDDVRILLNDQHEFVDEILVTIELEGKEFLIKNLIALAIEDGLLELENEKLP